MRKVQRALVSVSDKTGLVRFAEGLRRHGVEIISTGGTANTLAEAGVEVVPITDVTGFPEILDGRVKTLHPKIHGGLLADRRKESHIKEVEELEIGLIDLVVVNLYPFQETIQKPGVSLDEAIENIDIGGPSMIRSAAKNFHATAVVVNPNRYAEILAELDHHDGSISEDTRFELAKEAFRHTADYDEAIYEYLAGPERFPELFKIVLEKVQDLRYGENPHQKAAYYRDEMAPRHSLPYAQQLHGQALSFNNLLDLDAAWRLAAEFEQPAAIVIKHNNPCGVAVGDDLADAFVRAFDADALSAFGGIVGLNRPVDRALAEKMAAPFLEGIIAPGFMPDALELLTTKKNLRLMAMPEEQPYVERTDFKRVAGGVLIQDADTLAEPMADMKTVTTKLPGPDDWRDLLFAWRVAKHVRSNAIVLAKEGVTTGIGAGQMSRIDSTELAIKKGGDRVAGSALASDAFFPFPDAIAAAAQAGVRAVIQPGGSIRDEEVIAAANEHGMCMVFTASRHFRH